MRNLGLGPWLAGAGLAALFQLAPASAAGPRFLAGEVLVKLQPDVSANAEVEFRTRGRASATGELDDLFERFAVRQVRALGGSEPVYRFQLPAGAAVEEVASALGRDPRVAYAEPNFLYTFDALSQDPYVDGDGDGAFDAGAWDQDYANLWGLEAAGWGEVRTMASALWSSAPERTGGAGVVVAVIDSGLDVSHPDIAANVWRDAMGRPGRDFVNIDPQSLIDAGLTLDPAEDYVNADFDPADRNGHGTHVAGIIAAAADNGQGIAGVAWKAKVMPLRAGFNARINGRSVGLLDAAAIAEALRFAADSGAHIVNMSFGGPPSQTIGDAVTYTSVRGVTLVAAASNEGSPAPSFPASHSLVLAVGALDPSGRLAGYSNYGSAVALVAPGSDCLSLRAAGTELTGTAAVVGERYLRASGTSMAAPHAAGAAALARSLFPEESGRLLGARLAGTATPLIAAPFVDGGVRVTRSGGRLDLLHALSRPSEPHLALLDLVLDAAPTRNSNGDGVGSPGETVQLLLSLQNIWQPAVEGSISLTLRSGETEVEVLGEPVVVHGWPSFTTHRLDFALKIWGGVLPEQAVTLALEVRGSGFDQDLPVHLRLHEAPILKLVRSPSPSFDFAEILPAVAASSTGRLAVAWVRRTIAGPEYNEVRFQTFAPDGQPLTPEVRISPPAPDGFFRAPNVALDAAGAGAVVWTRDPATAGGGHFIELRLVDARGQVSPRIQPVNLNPADVVIDPRLSMHPDGRMAVSWWAAPNGGNGVAKLRLFDRQGQPTTGELDISAGEPGYHSNPDVHFAADGSLLALSRQSLPGDTIRLQVMARRIGADGSLGTPHAVLSSPSGSGLTPQLASAADGGWLAVWDHCQPFPPRGTGTCRVLARRLAADGAPQGPEIELAPDDGRILFSLAATTHESGTVGVVWTQCRAFGFTLSDCNPTAAVLPPLASAPTQQLVVDLREEAFDTTLAPTPDGFRLLWSGTSATGDDLYLRPLPLAREPAPCDPSAGSRLCLGEGEYGVEARFRDGQGRSGVATALPLTADSGALWFFSADNAELLVKALDGRGVNGFHWLFYGALSNVEYSLLVTESATGAQKLYFNPRGTMASRGDTRAFAATPARGASSDAAIPRGGGSETLELRDGRFAVTVSWRTPDGATGAGAALDLTRETGAFSFFDPANLELLVKVLDGRSVNGHYWVFFGALSNVEYTVRVTDRTTGSVKEYHNPQGTMASRADTAAFPP